MPLKTPKFWYRETNSEAPLIERLLWPISIIYGAGQRMNLSTHFSMASPVPVICLGNLVVGGGGKTPTLLALHKLIQKHNLYKKHIFVTRGYGGSMTGPHRVTSDHDTVQRVGDEPLLLAQSAETVVSRKRSDGVILAHKLCADLILMDDGFQNYTVDKTISLLVIDGASGFGNEKLLPAGPLRECISDGMQRADAVILIGKDERNVAAHIPRDLPVFKADLLSHFKGDKQKPYIAFCGLARPEKFKRSLDLEGLKILSFHEFPDHHIFTEVELAWMLKEAQDNNAHLLTTEKDYVRLPPNFREHIQTFPIEIIFENETAILEFIQTKLRQDE